MDPMVWGFVPGVAQEYVTEAESVIAMVEFWRRCRESNGCLAAEY